MSYPSFLKKFFLAHIFLSLRNYLPKYVIRSVIRLLPVSFMLSLFEVIGLVAVIPIMNIVIDPGLIESNHYIKYLYDRLGMHSHLTFVMFLLGAAAAVFVIKNAVLYWGYQMHAVVSFGIAARMAMTRYRTYLNKPYAFHINTNTAVLLRNITQVPFDLVSGVVMPFVIILNELIILLLIVAGILAYDAVLFLSVLAFVLPVFGLYTLFYKKSLEKISQKRNAGHRNMYRYGMQSMEAFREIVVFNKRDFFQPMFQKAARGYSDALGKLFLLNNFSPRIVESIAVISIFIIFAAGNLLQKDLAFLARFLVIFGIATYRIIPSFNRVIISFNNIKASYYVFDYFRDMREADEAVQPPRPASTSGPVTFRDRLELRGLTFIFEKQEVPVLKDINLSIRRGQKTGIIGPTGGGKTTLINVLLRLFTEDAGGIYLDGRKIDAGSTKDWYRLISYVPQNIVLLDGTVAENIAFGVPTAEIDDVLLQEVISMSQLAGFVDSLKDGVHTFIGEHGLKISGGQRQRIAIARALYHGGEILIFDEATSALDAETERALTESINSLARQNLTMIIVAHRIITLQHCDHIYRLEEGRLSGPFAYAEIS